jgi:hypothetical protein
LPKALPRNFEKEKDMIAIDFTPGEGVVPNILTLFDREGYTLHDIRLTPSARDERATLRLCVSQCPSADQFRPLAEELSGIDSVIEVIHRAQGAAC